MGALDQTLEHVLADRLRQLHRDLASTIDHSQRNEILGRIKEIEEEVRTTDRKTDR